MEKEQLKSKTVLQNVVKILCLVAAAAIWLVAVLVYGASVSETIIVLAFLVFYVQLPGLYITKVFRIRFDHLSTNIIVSAFAGWSLSILVYFISDVIPTDILLYLVGPILSAFYLCGLYNSYRKHREVNTVHFFRFNGIPVSFCIFTVLVLFYCFTSVQFRYLSPELDELITMNADKAYHIGLINSLSHDYPIESPWVSGIIIHYHVFSEMLFSIPVRLFGVPADFIFMSFSPIWTTYVFTLSTYSFFREMATVRERAGIYSLILLLSNIYITRSQYSSIAFKLALTNDNASGFGIAAVFVFIIMFKKWYELFSERAPERWGALVLLSAFVMLATGIKGPMGAVLVASVWGTLLLGMLLRKISVKSILPLGCITAGFLLVYLTVLSGKGTSNSSGSSLLAMAKIVDIAFWKKPLIAAMKAVGFPTHLRLVIVLIVFTVFFFTVFFVPFCIGYIRELLLVLSGKKAFLPERVLVYAACFVGFFLLMILNYSGHSQIYFGLVTVFLAPIVAYWFIEDMEACSTASRAAKHTLYVTLIIMLVGLFATTYSLLSYLTQSTIACVSSADPQAGGSKYNSISNDEYDALVWLRENTDKDSLIASDRYASVSPDDYSVDNRWDNRFFLYEVYSNRFSYISGSGYSIYDSDYEIRRNMLNTNKNLYDSFNAERGDQARELGIDYVVVSKRFTDAGDLSNDDYIKCFENHDVVIYEVTD